MINQRYYVSPKVRVADVIRHSSKDKKAWFSEFGKMSQKHFDFVLLDLESLEIKHVIELDDSSHTTEKQKKNDRTKDELAQKSGLNLIRVRTQGTYSDLETIKVIEGLKNENDQLLLRPGREDHKQRPSDRYPNGNSTKQNIHG